MTVRGNPGAPRPLGLKIIAAFKFVKAAALFTAGCVALNLVDRERAGWVQDWIDPGGSQGFAHLALGAFLLAGLFVVEGVGLSQAWRWAEYLTVAVTTSFLPIEVASSWHRWSLLRAGTIVLNLGVVAYLIAQLRTRSAARRPG